jgi:hypothetical protein
VDYKPPRFRIIWIAPRFPLGAPDGARHATRSVIHHLTQLHLSIDLICIIPSTEPADSAEVKTQLNVLSCSVIPRSSSKFLRLPSLTTPMTFRAFATSKIRRAFKEKLAILLKAENYSQDVFIVFDGLHPFAALSEFDLKDLSGQCRGIIYRAHNVETTFWEQCEAKARTPWFRLFFRYQAALVRTLERHVAKTVKLIAPVSEGDAVKFRALVPGANISVTPIGMDFPDENTIQPVRDSAKLELLFIGRLDWLPNRNGLTWFLENVWQQLRVKRQNVFLKIAGVGDGRWLQRFRNHAGIEFLGRVDDLQPLYESCSLSIAPLFQGSGTRVKIIESARYARAVVTTTLGAEGIGLVAGTSYFRAENQGEWLALLETISLDDSQRVGFASFQSLRERFDGNTIAERFAQALDSIAVKR